MLPHAILLLLCALLAAAQEPPAPPCPVAALNVKTAWILNNTELICVGGESDTRRYLKAIEVNSKRYASLACSLAEGWKDGNTKVADATTPLEFKCVEYCTATTEKTAIGGGYEEKLMTSVIDSEQGLVMNASCVDKDFDLLHNGRYVRGNYARCTLNDGWMGAGVKFTKNVYEAQHFVCRPAPLPCSFEEHVVNDFLLLNNTFDPESKRTTLACRSYGGKEHEIEFNSLRYSSLECDAANGWKDSAGYGWKAMDRAIASARSRPAFTCVEAKGLSCPTVAGSTLICPTVICPSVTCPEGSEDPKDPKNEAAPETETQPANHTTLLTILCVAVGAVFVVVIIGFFLVLRKGSGGNSNASSGGSAPRNNRRGSDSSDNNNEASSKLVQ